MANPAKRKGWVFYLEVPGDPVAQARAVPRISKRGKRWKYDPVECRNWKDYIKVLARAALKKPFAREVPLYAEIKVYLRRPISSKRPYPSVRPDLTNYIKGIEDALSGLVYYDDGQIISMNISKLYINDPAKAGAWIMIGEIVPDGDKQG